MSDCYIRLYQKIKNSLVGDNYVAMGFWVDILASAATKKRLLKNGTVLNPGECVLNLTDCARKARVHKRTLQRYVQVMVEEGMISVVNVSRNGTHISICNFKTYQPQFFDDVADLSRNGTATAPQRHRNGTQTYIDNNINNNNKNMGDASSKKFVPPSVEEVDAYIKERGYTFTARAFCSYYEARGWFLDKKKGMKMVSWKGACGTWHENQKRFQEKKKGGLFDE